LRIISGTHRGRPLHPPKNLPVRPTTDKAKESLFNILNNQLDFEGIWVLDLFTGTGNISYEFASRGAAFIRAVDSDIRCIKYVRSTNEKLEFDIKITRANVFSFLKTSKEKYDLIFADPPYHLERLPQIPDLILESGLLKNEGLLIVEHSDDQNFVHHPACFDTRTYSKVNFSFFKQDKPKELEK
jgi:16S rRNA (guanine966-N2)-methyltransferase